MKFQSKINETLFISEITPERSYMFDQDLKTGLSIIWNTKGTAKLRIDNEIIEIEKNCAIFLTEFHKIDDVHFEQMNVIQFNRLFYCIDEHDHETGCKGLLFFGGSQIPKISIPKDKLKHFQMLWEIVLMEMNEHDELKLEMLRALLKRFLILFLRIYKKEHTGFDSDHANIGLIREYNYLVEQHYKTYSKVSEFAKLLHKSPKTLSNIFKKYVDKTPLQIINDRRLLEAKRMLKYTDESILDISEKLNFKDLPSFSHFFNSRVKSSPSSFRNHLR